MDTEKIMNTAIDKMAKINEIILNNKKKEKELIDLVEKDYKKLKPSIDELGLKIKNDYKSLLIYDEKLPIIDFSKLNITKTQAYFDTLKIEYRFQRSTISYDNVSIESLDNIIISFNDNYSENFKNIDDAINSKTFISLISDLIVNSSINKTKI